MNKSRTPLLPLKKFLSNQSGAAALVLATASVPLVMAAGAAVDYGNSVAAQARLQAATDAAALAAGRESNRSAAELETIANRYFKSNYAAPSNADQPTMSLSVGADGRLQVNGEVKVKNYLIAIAGFSKTTVRASSQVAKDGSGLEVALVFDNTGSMGNQSRLSTLKVAARDFVNILFGPRETAKTLKIAVVPFSQFVNVGPEKATENWIDKAGLNAYSKANFSSSSWHNWKAWDEISNRSWTGCVESRAGALSVDDTAPDINNGATLFTPAFSPDEPGTDTSRAEFEIGDGSIYRYRNSYLADSNISSLNERLRHQDKYQSASVSTTSRGPDRGCNIQPILALNNVKQPVLDTLHNMTASGYTHVAEGVGWGLRVLSPGAPFTEGVSYSDPKITKAMVLLTDGENTFDSEPNHIRSTYTAYGYLGQARLGSTNYHTAVAAQNTLLQQACANVKAKEIVVYSFAYNVPSATQRNLIKNCATSPEKYFDPPTNAALVASFQQIADELRKLHLSR
ncbi:pilus assembly protein TadG-related protein [Anderseniella sp. Alg231-50]|uniref:pilus assembly protein TadG-related protein n=1 Tax=Anderseniella sp. Alg231-50 TaxID=1922226 RepID=UPI000D54C86E